MEVMEVDDAIPEGTPISNIYVTPLGAGRDVGRSCILLHMGGKTIMLDCGMHMGETGERRFPDFRYISAESPCSVVDCVLITHFHLDHCGALPYFTEVIGYNGPIYMSLPTKAIAPILIEDMRRIGVDLKGEMCMFTAQQVKDCMKKVTAVSLHQDVRVDNEIEIRAYYAGHVLGAVMFWIKVGQQTVVYTGDFNMTPDRHLGAAWVDKCRPNILITESTYATTIRESKRCREADFLKKVRDCIEEGGKILIPVFALGRAQELCILLDTYWERMNIKAPIYFAAGLTEKANNYYKLFITWTNQKVKNTFVDRNVFDFRHIKQFDKSYMNNPGPMVVFATPGMLHAGLSLQLFKKWAPCEKNLLIMPGFCVKGTVGYQVVQGAKKIKFEKENSIDVRMGIEYMSFSAHADLKGIIQLIQYCEPDNVLLVHGEAGKMAYLRNIIQKEYEIPCFMPKNGETAVIKTPLQVPISISTQLLKTLSSKPDNVLAKILRHHNKGNEDGVKENDDETVSRGQQINLTSEPAEDYQLTESNYSSDTSSETDDLDSWKEISEKGSMITESEKSTTLEDDSLESADFSHDDMDISDDIDNQNLRLQVKKEEIPPNGTEEGEVKETEAGLDVEDDEELMNIKDEVVNETPQVFSSQSSTENKIEQKTDTVDKNCSYLNVMAFSDNESEDSDTDLCAKKDDDEDEGSEDHNKTILKKDSDDEDPSGLFIHGVLVTNNSGMSLMDIDEITAELGVPRHIIRFTSSIKLNTRNHIPETISKIYSLLKARFENFTVHLMAGNTISIETYNTDSVLVKVEYENENDSKRIYVSWINEDEELGSSVLETLESLRM